MSRTSPRPPIPGKLDRGIEKADRKPVEYLVVARQSSEVATSQTTASLPLPLPAERPRRPNSRRKIIHGRNQSRKATEITRSR